MVIGSGNLTLQGLRLNKEAFNNIEISENQYKKRKIIGKNGLKV